MRRLAWPAALIALSVVTAACTTVVRAPGVAVRVSEMPAVRHETPPPPPGVEWQWVPGHWVWRDAWVWAPGHYVAHAVPPMPPPRVEVITVAPSAAHVWVRGHWHWGGGAWVWAQGRWVLG